MLVKRTEYSHSDQSVDTRVSERLVAWLKQEIVNKAVATKALEQKLIDERSVWLEEKIREFLLELREYDKEHNLRLLLLFGATADDFAGNLKEKNQRGRLIQAGIDAFVGYLKNKTDDPAYPDGRQFCQSFKSTGLTVAVQNIIREDDKLKSRHSAAVRTVADEIAENGFLPEIYVTSMHLAPHTMAEKDVSKVLADLIDKEKSTTLADGRREVVVVKAPIQPLTQRAELQREILREAKCFELKNAPAKVTMLFAMQDGSSHYDTLQITLAPSAGKDVDATILLKNSMKKPPTQDTATYKSLDAVKNAVAALDGVAVAKADVEFSGDQDDAVSCSFRTVRSICQTAAADDEKFKDINKAATLSQVKLAVTSRLVAADVAKDLKIDDKTGVICSATLKDEKLARFVAYQDQHLLVHPASKEHKAAPVTKSKYAAISKKITTLTTDEKISKFNYGKSAYSIYNYRETVQKTPASSTTGILSAITSDIDTLVTKSQKAVEIVRQKPDEVKPVVVEDKERKAYDELQAFEALKKSAKDVKVSAPVEQARKTISALHEKMTLESSVFDASAAGPARALSAQEAEDAKLARIVQNQFILDHLRGRKSSTESERLARELQIKADEELARKLASGKI